MSERRAFAATQALRPDRHMFDATVWRVDVAPLETPTPNGHRVQLGFPVLYIPATVNAPEVFAKRVAKILAEHFAADPSQAVTDVIAERRRQVAEEGWTAEHDDEKRPGDLAAAAACYAVGAVEELDIGVSPSAPPKSWPWDASWWKPNGVRRALVKAAALIIAEIEKIDRKAASAGEQP